MIFATDDAENAPIPLRHSAEAAFQCGIGRLRLRPFRLAGGALNPGQIDAAFGHGVLCVFGEDDGLGHALGH